MATPYSERLQDFTSTSRSCRSLMRKSNRELPTFHSGTISPAGCSCGSTSEEAMSFALAEYRNSTFPLYSTATTVQSVLLSGFACPSMSRGWPGSRNSISFPGFGQWARRRTPFLSSTIITKRFGRLISRACSGRVNICRRPCTWLPLSATWGSFTALILRKNLTFIKPLLINPRALGPTQISTQHPLQLRQKPLRLHRRTEDFYGVYHFLRRAVHNVRRGLWIVYAQGGPQLLDQLPDSADRFRLLCADQPVNLRVAVAHAGYFPVQLRRDV